MITNYPRSARRTTLFSGLLLVGLTLLVHRLPAQTTPPVLSLAEDSRQELAERTNGNCEYTGLRSPANFFQTTPQLAPNFWLADITNILAGSQGQIIGREGSLLSCANYMTPITPHVCVVTWHTVHGENGFKGRVNVWLRPDGTCYTNVSLQATNVFGDLGLVLMAQTNWTSVKILPNIAPKVAAWRTGDFKLHPAPCAVRFHLGIGSTNLYHTTFVSGLTGMGSFAPVGGLEFGNYAFGHRWVSGDSSGPSYVVLHREAVFIGQVSAAGGVMAVGAFSNLVVTATADLCAQAGLPPEYPQFYDVSNFPDE